MWGKEKEPKGEKKELFFSEIKKGTKNELFWWEEERERDAKKQQGERWGTKDWKPQDFRLAFMDGFYLFVCFMIPPFFIFSEH